MSRINYADDYESDADMLRSCAFEANMNRHLKGKKGQALLRELLAALEAMPEKAIATGHFVDESGDVCPLGALWVHRRGGDRQAAVAELREKFAWYDGDYDSEEAIEQIEGMLGVKKVFAWAVMEKADEIFDRLTPEKRYEAIVAWVRKRLL